MGDWLGGNGGIINQEGSDLDGLKLNVDSAVAVLRRKLIIGGRRPGLFVDVWISRLK